MRKDVLRLELLGRNTFLSDASKVIEISEHSLSVVRKMILLAGDVGGTKTNLALCSSEIGVANALSEQSFPSEKYPDLESMLHEFLRNEKSQIDSACFGVAGPVINGRAGITNLNWIVDENNLAREFKLASAHVINDLVATSYFVPHLTSEKDVYPLNKGNPVMNGNLAVIAPGTGLGEASLIWDGSRYRPIASEGGHCDFAPFGEAQIEMLQDLHELWDHVSWERVCSGLGMRNIYNYYHKDPIFAYEKAAMENETAGLEDPAPFIVEKALTEKAPCSTCQATLNTFVEILGAEAGNLALKVLATGGVYLGGGIPPKIIPALTKGLFMQAFQRKGRMSNLLAKMPVKVIMNPRAALLGAAQYGLDASATGEKS
jgi:glucokinase